MMSKKKINILLLLIIMMIPYIVTAADTTNCCNVGKCTPVSLVCLKLGDNLPSQEYALGTLGSNVVPCNITYEDVNGGVKGSYVTSTKTYKNVTAPASCYCSQNTDDLSKCFTATIKNGKIETKTCKDTNKIVAEYAGSNCGGVSATSNGYSFTLCPNSSYKLTAMNVKFSPEWDYTNGGWYLKYDISGLNNDSEKEELSKKIGLYQLKSDNEDSYFIDPSDIKKKYTPSEVQPNTQTGYKGIELSYLDNGYYYFATYISDSSSVCNNSTIGRLTKLRPSKTAINMWYGSEVCSALNDYPSVVKASVSACNKKALDTTNPDESKYLRNTTNTEVKQEIEEQIKKVTKEYDDRKASAKNATNVSYKCHFDSNNNYNDGVYTKNALKNETDPNIIHVGTTYDQEIKGKDYGYGTYWTVMCDEYLDIEYGEPIETSAGQLINYNVSLTVSRKCEPHKIMDPISYPSCSFAIRCNGGLDNDVDTGRGGPNDDFDDCVLECDGGKYTQSCINACYKKIYKLDDSKKFSFEQLKESSNIIKVANSCNVVNFEGPDCKNCSATSSSCCTGYSRQGSVAGCDGPYTTTKMGTEKYWCTTENGTTFSYSTWCAGTRSDLPAGTPSTLCEEVVENYPCATNAAEYNAGQKCLFEKEKAAAESVAKSKDGIGSTDDTYYEIIVDELYDEDVKGEYKTKTTKFTSKTKDVSKNNNIYLIGKTEEKVETIKDCSSDNPDSDVVGCFKKKINLQIGYSSMDTKTSIVTYNNSSNFKENTKLDKNSSNMKLNSYVNDFGYYLDIHTHSTINNVLYWPSNSNKYDNEKKYLNSAKKDENGVYSTKNGIFNGYNISVNIYNVGSWGEFGKTVKNTEYSKNKNGPLNIKCFYGVGPNVPTCKDKTCMCAESTETPGLYYLDDGSTTTNLLTFNERCCGGNGNCPGLDFIFRVINLNDVFPNEDVGRIPRFNWNENASLSKEESKYDNEEVNPIKLTSVIENKGNGVYTDDSEVDYEFTLSRAQIRNIKKYNKGKVYNNYDGMYCSNSNGNSICYSTFLDNASYVTIDKTKRQAISKCNNAKSGGCDVSIFGK